MLGWIWQLKGESLASPRGGKGWCTGEGRPGTSSELLQGAFVLICSLSSGHWQDCPSHILCCGVGQWGKFWPLVVSGMLGFTSRLEHWISTTRPFRAGRTAGYSQDCQVTASSWQPEGLWQAPSMVVGYSYRNTTWPLLTHKEMGSIRTKSCAT